MQSSPAPTPPADSGPRIFTVNDRQIYIPGEGAPSGPSVYSLSRSWIQNIPAPETLPPATRFNLPQTLTGHPLSALEVPPPLYSDDFGSNYNAQDALNRLKDHWVSVRLHFQEAQRRRFEVQQLRLRPWLLPSNMVAADPPAVPPLAVAGQVPGDAGLPPLLPGQIRGFNSELWAGKGQGGP